MHHQVLRTKSGPFPHKSSDRRATRARRAWPKPGCAIRVSGAEYGGAMPHALVSVSSVAFRLTGADPTA
jgi:hypothetical protein